ncbi:MAG: Bug family tripartite tricarboxylate transporter substrate binding protein [Xanthobacteraceae bacterium]
MTRDFHAGAWRRRIGRLAVALLVATGTWLAADASASAQNYPTRAVKIIVPFPAGGTADAMPRVVAEYLSRKWKQPVVIENRSGAGGNVGAESAYKSDPDGYTLLSAPAPPLVINQNLYPKLGFDPLKFERIAVMGLVPNALLTNPGFPPKSVAEVIAYAKANPGKVISATQGNGTTSHLTSEMFQMLAKVKVTHVPYRGAAPAMNDLVGGTANIMFNNLGTVLGQVKGGKIRLLAVASAKRLASLPDVPTMAETLPGFESEAWFAVVAPPGTPKQIVQKLNADINEALRDPGVMKRMRTMSAEIVGGSLQDTDKYMTAEVARWLKVIKAANVKLK